MNRSRPPRRSSSRSPEPRSLAGIEPFRCALDEAAQLASVRNALRAYLSGLTPEAVDDVLLACGEALDNALEHGVPPVEIVVHASPTLVARIHDRGVWRADRSGDDRGRGLPLMRAVAQVDVQTGQGTTLTLAFDPGIMKARPHDLSPGAPAPRRHDKDR